MLLSCDGIPGHKDLRWASRRPVSGMCWMSMMGKKSPRVWSDAGSQTHSHTRASRKDTVCLIRGGYGPRKRGLRETVLSRVEGACPLSGVVGVSARTRLDPGRRPWNSSTGVSSYVIGPRLYQQGEMCTDGARGSVRCRGQRRRLQSASCDPGAANPISAF